MRRSAGLPRHDAGQRLDLIDIRLVVDIDPGTPIAAAHLAWNLDDEPESDARQLDVAEFTIIDPHPAPGLAISFRRRMFSER